MAGLGARRWMLGATPLLLLLFCTVAAGPAEARRVALVIGNSAYTSVSALENPKNDAAALAETLRAIGFDEVRELLDLDQTAFRRALRDFTALAAGAETAVVYYAGHGVEVDGRNYLVPVDAMLGQATDAEFEAIPLDSVRTAVSGASSLRLVILDACRNNPFKLASTDGTRSVGRGLARVEPGANEIVAYAAREGTVANDGTGGNSPYATALIRHLKTPGLDVRLLFGEVRDEVMAATGRTQEPFIYGTLGGKPIYLSEPAATAAAAAPATATAPVAEPAASSRDKQAAEAWIAVKDTSSVGILKTYIARFEGTIFADMAAARLAEIETASNAPATKLSKLADIEAPPVLNAPAPANAVAVASVEEPAQDGYDASAPPPPEQVTLEPGVYPVGKWAEGAAWDGALLWVAESGQRSLAALDLSSGIVRHATVGRLPVGVEATADGSVYSLQNTDKTVWVQPRGGGKGKRFAKLSECPQDIAVTAKAVWVLTWPDCSSANAKAIRIDIKTGTQQQTGFLGEWGESIAFAHGAAWVGHVRGDTISRIDPASLDVEHMSVDSVSVWKVTANDRYVFAGGRVGEDNNQGVILAIDPASRTQTSRQDVGELILRLAADARHVVAVGANGTIWVMAAETLAIERVITLSTGPYRPSDALLVGNQLMVIAQQLNGENGAVLVVNDWEPSSVAVSGD